MSENLIQSSSGTPWAAWQQAAHLARATWIDPQQLCPPGRRLVLPGAMAGSPGVGLALGATGRPAPAVATGPPHPAGRSPPGAQAQSPRRPRQPAGAGWPAPAGAAAEFAGLFAATFRTGVSVNVRYGTYRVLATVAHGCVAQAVPQPLPGTGGASACARGQSWRVRRSLRPSGRLPALGGA